tara:strand:+ start:412 stop:1962 length:1551 start_codon:yes stop_codon:yes gene_type:complete
MIEKVNFSKNYLKIYFWKILSISSGFLSLLIVVPNLSSDMELYGIYSLCISFTLYLSYADIGFLSAGQKYAAEAYARNNRIQEVEILGFTGAILLLMVIPFSFFMILLSFDPSIIINDLSENGMKISSVLFLIIGTLLPLQIILQRLVQSILIIRIKDYVFMRIELVFNLLKIGSVFYFFNEDSYMLIEYYFFICALTIISSTVILLIIKKNESYDFYFLFKSIKLRKKEFHLTKKLALSSFLLTIGWILYFELDLIIIAKWFTPELVAIYAIGFTFLNFLRNLWNYVFSPFAQRFNHYSALNYDSELKKLIEQIINFTLPLCIIVTLTLILASDKIVYYWVGQNYKDSILILQVLIAGTCFGFVTNPASYFFIAKTKYNYLNLLSVILPLTFFLALFALIPNFDVLGVSISKTLTMFIGFIIYFVGLKSFYNPFISIKKTYLELIIISFVLIFLVPYILETLFASNVKSTINLILLLITLFIIIIFSYLIILFSNKEMKRDFKVILSNFNNEKRK